MQSEQTKTVPSFGYDLLREDVLRSILGKHEEDILYWAGKDLARKYILDNEMAIAEFFIKAGWGLLTLEKEKKDERLYKISGNAELLRTETRCFRLEAGFLAEQYEHMRGFLTECYCEVNTKEHAVYLTLRTDFKEPVVK
ncbi:MAG: YslB family protein [Caryophanon sp.]|nr:YslB family protein [Caryophanon sp.]